MNEDNTTITMLTPKSYVKKAKVLEAHLGLKNRSVLFRELVDERLVREGFKLKDFENAEKQP